MLGTFQRGAMGLHTRGMGKLVREATNWRQVGQPLGSLLVRNGHRRGFATDGLQQRFDVLVIGGGIMGSSTAHWLARKTNGQLKVCVVEPDPSYSTSATTLSVGGLRQQFSLRENIRIGLYARDFMRSYPSSMAWGGLDPESLPGVNFQPHGYLFLATKVQILQKKSLISVTNIRWSCILNSLLTNKRIFRQRIAKMIFIDNSFDLIIVIH